MIFNREIENGTVNPELANFTTKFSISTSDVYDTVPGSIAYQNFDDGAAILQIDLTNLTLYIEKDWTNRRSLSNQKSIVLKNGNFTKILNFSKIYPAEINSQPATRIVLSSDTLPADLYNFVGLTGTPAAIGKAYLSLYSQNEFPYNDHSTEFQLQKFLQSQEREEYYVNFSWKNNFNVKKNSLRWRATPSSTRITQVYYSVLDSGEYTTLPSASVVSAFGVGESIELSGAVKRVEVVNGGSFVGTPNITAYYAGASGASLSVGMTGGSILSVSVISGGSGYNSSPSLIISGATVLSAPVLVPYVEIESVNVLEQGYDYLQFPTVTLQGGSGASGSIGATVQVINAGRVDYVSVLAAGSGYTDGATVSFVGGGGNGASGIIQTVNGEIVSVKMLDYGAGYTSEPLVSVAGGSSASLSANVSMFSDWNYAQVDPAEANYTLYNLKKYLQYEWQVYSATEKKQDYVNYSQLFNFNFF